MQKIHGRRHKILLDAHTHGVNIRGKLLFDYHAMPFTRMPLLEVPGEELVLVREGYSEGGENPNGWSAKTMPYLMEYDNWGGLVVDDRENITERRTGLERLVGIRPDRLVCQPAGGRPESFSGIYLQVDRNQQSKCIFRIAVPPDDPQRGSVHEARR